MVLLHSGHRSAPHSGRSLPEHSDLLHIARRAIGNTDHGRLRSMKEGRSTPCRVILPPVSAQRSTRYWQR